MLLAPDGGPVLGANDTDELLARLLAARHGSTTTARATHGWLTAAQADAALPPPRRW